MEKHINILIVEDEFINRIHIKKTLQSLGYPNVFEAGNASDALVILKEREIDFTILDINLENNERDGVWIAKHINKNYKMPFIYLTAYITPDILGKAIKTLPYAYLVKPFNQSDLMTSIELALHKFCKLAEGEEGTCIVIKEKNHYKKIDTQDILYVESDGNYINLHTKESTHRCRSTIKNIINNFSESNFVQTHRGFVVNINKISKFYTSHVLVNEIKIPVSRKYAHQLANYKIVKISD